MHSANIEESAFIKASPLAVYNLLSDYRVGHLAALPKPYFVDMKVLEGGFGEGTVVQVEMDVYGAKRTMLMHVTEPEKGYILQEVAEKAGVFTQFIFEPVDGGCKLSIRTKMNFGTGFMGFLEKLSTPAITRNIYRQELKNIAAYLLSQPQKA